VLAPGRRRPTIFLLLPASYYSSGILALLSLASSTHSSSQTNFFHTTSGGAPSADLLSYRRWPFLLISKEEDKKIEISATFVACFDSSEQSKRVETRLVGRQLRYGTTYGTDWLLLPSDQLGSAARCRRSCD
jgi:hypothetical protein